MKKRILSVVSIILLIAGIAYAKDYEVNKKTGDYDVKVSIDKNPPSVGKNNLTIEIKNASGVKVTNAEVKVEYSMPAMSGMPAMNYKSDATLDNDEYKATIDLSMGGSWNITVRIKHLDKRLKVKFTIDA